ncbi:MAG: hypothetical protein U0I99_02215, partial [Dialister sp.]|nr:hypothetical protein [Dialister sp.]
SKSDRKDENGNFVETAGGLDQFSKLCGLSSFSRHGAARKSSHFYPTLYAAWHLTDNRESQV